MKIAKLLLRLLTALLALGVLCFGALEAVVLAGCRDVFWILMCSPF